jgi:acetolactate synthase-1/2/3 large subunit
MTWSRATSDVSGMAELISPLFRQADGLLALGCRFSQAATGSWVLPLGPGGLPLAQVDVDPGEVGRHYPAELGVCGDLRPTLEVLLAALPPEPRAPWAIIPRRPPWRLPGPDILGPLRKVLPGDAIVSADVTRLAYMLMTDFPLDYPRTFLHPAGSVAMGFALPAALGARAAWPGRKVVAVVGDGGFLMSGMELATAVQEGLGVVVLLVNDSTLTLIKATQERRYAGRYIGVDLVNPDFGLFARAFGVRYALAETDEALEEALRAALEGEQPAVVEVRPKNV